MIDYRQLNADLTQVQFAKGTATNLNALVSWM
jgi:hypothetical protein